MSAIARVIGRREKQRKMERENRDLAMLSKIFVLIEKTVFSLNTLILH